MQSTKDIKRRMRGITSTRQITKAMELVSTAKLRKARTRLFHSRPYYQTVLENIQSVMEFVQVNHPYIKQRDVEKSLLVVITSDRGLAGGYNNNVLELAEEIMKEEPEKYPLIVIGEKAEEFFKKMPGAEIIKAFKGFPEVIEFEHAKMISDIVMDMYQKEEVDEVISVFTRFESTLQYTPLTLKLLPFEDSESDEEEVEEDKGPVRIRRFEPSADEVLDFLIPQYVEIAIYGALIEASASEQASRRTAMEAATENADEMLEELEVSFNRARQAAITNEISEIVSGADALK